MGRKKVASDSRAIGPFLLGSFVVLAAAIYNLDSQGPMHIPLAG